jgi:hypothetical protein
MSAGVPLSQVVSSQSIAANVKLLVYWDHRRTLRACLDVLHNPYLTLSDRTRAFLQDIAAYISYDIGRYPTEKQAWWVWHWWRFSVDVEPDREASQKHLPCEGRPAAGASA